MVHKSTETQYSSITIDITISMQMQEPSDEQILKDLFYELAREMPAEDVALQMYKDRLLLHNEWEDYKKLKEDKGEYLLSCLRRSHEPGFMQKFCSVLDTVGAKDLLKKVSHRMGNAVAICTYM